MSITHPTLGERASYGWRVMRRAAGVMTARYDDGPALSAAWRVSDVSRLFHQRVVERGCALVGDLEFNRSDIADEHRWTNRGRFFSGFSMLARKR
jgi:hypothetical protein